jgi:hypothetical protein
VELAALKVGYPKAQAPFIQSLGPSARAEVAKANKNPLGKDVPFACVVCKPLKWLETDFLVSPRSQWPDDLQQGGVRAVHAPTNHFMVMKDAAAAKAIAELAREPLARWSPEETEKARKVLFSEPVPPREK